MEEINYDQLHKYLHEAELLIKDMNFSAAKELLVKSLLINDRSPQVHNLFGVIYEYQGNKEMAMRHYRAANVFDGTFKPAIENMIRCSDNNCHGQKHPNFGADELSFEERRQQMQNGEYHG
ncbi:MAG: hypothetical protein CVU94_06195 [Firmicutes bacterium HGW-Firmicutes-19]|jgi:Flp pilus assembly protein TadD|nr:MAG: hypothetical protein CVU94_06195 [Firmicutes bacterium HGW-Firmicutes-19]